MIDSKLGPDPFHYGHSVQGGKVFTNAGELWAEFETHAEALAALAAFRHGFKKGKEAGAEQARREVRTVLGLDGVTQFANPPVIR